MLVYARLLTIPSLSYEYYISNEFTSFQDINRIVVDDRYAELRDHGGETSIPPTLAHFANTLQNDLQKIFDLKIPVEVQPLLDKQSNSLVLTIDDSSSVFLDAAGRHSTEGYALNVTHNSIKIAGASPLGTWWGTRTVLQAAVLYGGKIPHGRTADTPGWRSRGAMVCLIVLTYLCVLGQDR